MFSRTLEISLFKRLFSTKTLKSYDSNTVSEFIKKYPVVAFIKGSHNNPRCGFSASVINILQLNKANDAVFVDVLENNEIGPFLKTYSNWPTFPQVYINGKLIGGYDIMKELHTSGNITPLLEQAGVKNN